jgi:hypothetical protein
MVVHDGRYTGEIDFYAAGDHKVTEVQKLAAERGYDLGESFAYSDSITDVPMLSCVGHPTAVNPDRGLRKVAAEKGWPVLEFRHPVPLSRRWRERPAVPVTAAVLVAAAAAAAGLILWGRVRKARAAAATAGNSPLLTSG